MMRTTLLLAVPMLLAGCMSHNVQGTIRTAECPTPSEHALRQVADLKRVLADTNGVMTEYRAGLGFAGVSPNSVVGVTDPHTCSAVTAAVASYLRRTDPMAENLFVVRVGPRYVALDPNQESAAQYVLTRKYEVTNYLAP